MQNLQETSAEFARLRKMNAANDIVASILAREKLNIVYSRGRTAYFDPDSRTIYIPYWNVNNETSLMLRCHEMAHALFTPAIKTNGSYSFHSEESQVHILPDNIRKHVNPKTFFTYMNVCEDDRIERKVSELFPGVRRILKSGHNNLFDLGFYPTRVKGEELPENELLANKALFYSRFGIESPVIYRLNNIEREILKEMTEASSFEDMVHAAFEMYMFDHKNAKKNQSPPNKKQEESGKSDDENNDPDVSFDQNESEESKDQNEQNDGSEESKDQNDSGENGESETDPGEEQKDSDESGSKTQDESDGDEASSKESGERDSSSDDENGDDPLENKSFDSNNYYNHLNNDAPMKRNSIGINNRIFVLKHTKEEIKKIRVVVPLL